MNNSENNFDDLFNVWSCFTGIVDGEEKVKCLECNKNLKCKGGSTSGLLRHLSGIHGITKNNWCTFGKQFKYKKRWMSS